MTLYYQIRYQQYQQNLANGLIAPNQNGGSGWGDSGSSSTTWVSKDPSSPYYGTEVAQNPDTGKIEPVSQGSTSSEPTLTGQETAPVTAALLAGSAPVNDVNQPTLTPIQQSTNSTYVSPFSPYAPPPSAYGTSSQQYGTVSPTGQILTPPTYSPQPTTSYSSSYQKPASYGSSPYPSGTIFTAETTPGQPVQVSAGVYNKLQSGSQPLSQQLAQGAINQASDKFGGIAGPLSFVERSDYPIATPVPLMANEGSYGKTLSLSTFSDTALRLETKADQSPDLGKKALFRVGALAPAFVSGAGSLLLHPIASGKGLLNSMFHPVESTKSMLADLQERPALTAGTLAGQSVVLGFAGSKVGEGLKKAGVSVESVKLPTPKGETTVFRGLAIKDKPLVGYGQGNVILGYKTPKVDFAPEKYTPVTALEGRMALDLAKGKYPEAELTKAGLSLDLVKETYGTKSKYIEALPAETKTLGQPGVSVIMEFARREKALLYGSYTAEAQLPKGALAKGRGLDPSKPAVGDIDLQLNIGEAETAVKAQSLAKQLQAAGENVRISPQKPTLIESLREGKYHHAVDIHSNEVPLMEEIPKEGAFGFGFGEKPVKRGGLSIMSLSETGTRKMASSLTMREEGFAPEPHRAKDIPDFLTTEEYLLRSKGAGKQSFANLEDLRSIYEQQGALPRSGNTVRIKLGDYSPSVSSIPSLKPSPGLMAASSASISTQTSREIRAFSKMSSVSVARSTSPNRSLGASSSVSLPSISSVSRSASASSSTSTSSPSIGISSLGSSVSPSSKLPSLNVGSVSSSLSPSPSRSISPSIGSPGIASIGSSPSPSKRSPSTSLGKTSSSLSPGSPRSKYTYGSTSIRYKVKTPPPPPPVPLMPKFDFEPDRERQGRKKKVKGEPKFYVPSVTAIIAGITAKSGKTKGLSGLELRPILVGKRNRKKNQK